MTKPPPRPATRIFQSDDGSIEVVVNVDPNAPDVDLAALTAAQQIINELREQGLDG